MDYIARWAVVAMMTIVVGNVIMRQFGSPIDGTVELVGFLAALVIGLSIAYWLDLRDYSPTKTANQLNLPMLFLQGERDYQVTIDDFDLWNDALKNHENVTLKSYSQLNHLFIKGEGLSLPDEYLEPGFVDEKVIKDIYEWIKGIN